MLVFEAFGVERSYFRNDNYDEDSELLQSYKDGKTESELSYYLTDIEKWFAGNYAVTLLKKERDSLEDAGFSASLSYIGILAGNPVGGYAQGTTNTSSLGLVVGWDLQRTMGLKSLEGWSLLATCDYNSGISLSNNYIRNSFDVQENYSLPYFVFGSLFLNYSKSVSDNWRLKFKIGRISPGDDFMNNPIYWLYINSALSGTQYTLYSPDDSWGALVGIRNSNGMYLRTAIYQISEYRNTYIFNHGFDWTFNGTGVNFVAELGWNINKDTAGENPSSVSVGFSSDWCETGFLKNPNESRNFNYLFYFQADSLVLDLGYAKIEKKYEPSHSGAQRYRDKRGIALWTLIQYAPDERLSYIPLQINCGILFQAPFESRPCDVACFGVAYGKYSKDLNTNFADGYETIVELNYKFSINKFMFVQPGIQYVINPSNGEYPNALVLAIQYGINL